jgi:4-methyl-5(b-hydroxyethyl)-thiazole monophosphate biosynthesis
MYIKVKHKTISIKESSNSKQQNGCFYTFLTFKREFYIKQGGFMKKTLFLLADGFEEIEMVVPFDILKRGEIEVHLASITDSLSILGAHGLTIQAEHTLSQVKLEDYDALFLPGGGLGVENLSKSDAVISTLQHFAKNDKWIAAICAAPKVLAKAKLIQNHTVTSFPSVQEEVEAHAKHYSQKRVVIDSKIITSRAAGTAEEFALNLLKLLKSETVSQDIQKQILARDF